MNSLGKLTQVLGWCTAINFGILLLWLLEIPAFREVIASMMTMIFGLAEEETRLMFVTVMIQYELLVIVFNFVPYIALKIVARPTST